MAKNEELSTIVREIKYLRDMTQKDIAKEIGVTAQYLSDAINGRFPFTDELRARLHVLCTSKASAPVHSEEEVLTDSNSLKHFYEMDVTASNIENLTDNEQKAPFRRLLIPGYEGCVAFNVAGESMLPTARPGDLAAIDPRPVERIVNGEIYMLVTRDGQRMIKRLMRLPDDTGVRCFSDNDKKQWYAPFDIEAEIVVHAYRVRGFISITNLV